MWGLGFWDVLGFRGCRGLGFRGLRGLGLEFGGCSVLGFRVAIGELS